MKALIVSATPDAHLLKAVLTTRGGIEVNLLESLEYTEMIKIADLLIIDHGMWLAEMKNQLKPNALVILLSHEVLTVSNFDELQVAGYLKLPFKIETIVSLIRDLLYFYEHPSSRRKEQRYTIEFPAVLTFSGKDYPVTVIDIGKSGFRILFDTEYPRESGGSEETGVLTVNTEELKFSAEFIPRWSHYEEDKMALGGEWTELNDEQSGALIAFIALHTGVFKF